MFIKNLVAKSVVKSLAELPVYGPTIIPLCCLRHNPVGFSAQLDTTGGLEFMTTEDAPLAPLGAKRRREEEDTGEVEEEDLEEDEEDDDLDDDDDEDDDFEDEEEVGDSYEDDELDDEDIFYEEDEDE